MKSMVQNNTYRPISKICLIPFIRWHRGRLLTVTAMIKNVTVNEIEFTDHKIMVYIYMYIRKGSGPYGSLQID